MRTTVCQPRDDHGGNGGEFQQHQETLHVAAAAHTEAIDQREDDQGHHRNPCVGQRGAGQLDEVFSERRSHGGHPARLHHEQQRPTVEKGDRRMVGIAQVRILTSGFRTESGQLCVH